MVEALTAWQSRLGEWEALAVLVGKMALAKVFDDPAAQSEMVVSAIARRMMELRHQSVISVRVSDEDFPDEVALARIAVLAGKSVETLATGELASGECTIDLKLGKMDIGPKTQWAALGALLDRIVQEEPFA